MVVNGFAFEFIIIIEYCSADYCEWTTPTICCHFHLFRFSWSSLFSLLQYTNLDVVFENPFIRDD